MGTKNKKEVKNMYSERTLKLCERIKEENLKKIDQKIMYVLFNFGALVYLGVNIYEKLTLDECIYLRSEDIDEYYDEENKQWIKVSK